MVEQAAEPFRDFLRRPVKRSVLTEGLTAFSYVVGMAGNGLVVGDGIVNLQQQPGQLGRLSHPRSVVEPREEISTRDSKQPEITRWCWQDGSPASVQTTPLQPQVFLHEGWPAVGPLHNLPQQGELIWKRRNGVKTQENGLQFS